ncbi:hypothetical protein JCGZ_03761 [Jatropha curcas]|uniref:Uncharacterized protein n=1 Tax=Jatropha curcas TaxID=180498 RepID=A0A067KW34_JATCU|nr:hypothetical protein JCGZ_03761 [Jatropha curcas]
MIAAPPACCVNRNKKEGAKKGDPSFVVERERLESSENRGTGGSTRLSDRRMSRLSCAFCVPQKRKKGEKGGRNPLRRGGEGNAWHWSPVIEKREEERARVRLTLEKKDEEEEKKFWISRLFRFDSNQFGPI